MFIPTSETELLNMKNLEKCCILKRTHPDYSTQTKYSCLIEIMTNIKTESFQTQVMKLLNTLWIRLRSNQDWLATAPSEEILHILCRNIYVLNLKIKGSFILHLDSECTATTSLVILRPSTKISVYTNICIFFSFFFW